MNQFTAKYADAIRFVLCGFDRLVFRGTIRGLSFVDGMRAYLRCHQVDRRRPSAWRQHGLQPERRCRADAEVRVEV